MAAVERGPPDEGDGDPRDQNAGDGSRSHHLRADLEAVGLVDDFLDEDFPEEVFDFAVFFEEAFDFEAFFFATFEEALPATFFAGVDADFLAGAFFLVPASSNPKSSSSSCRRRAMVDPRKWRSSRLFRLEADVRIGRSPARISGPTSTSGRYDSPCSLRPLRGCRWR